MSPEAKAAKEQFARLSHNKLRAASLAAVAILLDVVETEGADPAVLRERIAAFHKRPDVETRIAVAARFLVVLSAAYENDGGH